MARFPVLIRACRRYGLFVESLFPLRQKEVKTVERHSGRSPRHPTGARLLSLSLVILYIMVKGHLRADHISLISAPPANDSAAYHRLGRLISPDLHLIKELIVRTAAEAHCCSKVSRAEPNCFRVATFVWLNVCKLSGSRAYTLSMWPAVKLN